METEKIKVKLMGPFALEIPSASSITENRRIDFESAHKFEVARKIRAGDSLAQQLLVLLILAHRYLRANDTVMDGKRIRRAWLAKCLFGEDTQKTRSDMRYRLDKLQEAFSLCPNAGLKDQGVEVDFSALEIDILQNDIGDRLVEDWTYPWLTQDESIRLLRLTHDERFMAALHRQMDKTVHIMQLAEHHNNSTEAGACRSSVVAALDRAAERMLLNTDLLSWLPAFVKLFHDSHGRLSPKSSFARLITHLQDSPSGDDKLAGLLKQVLGHPENGAPLGTTDGNDHGPEAYLEGEYVERARPETLHNAREAKQETNPRINVGIQGVLIASSQQLLIQGNGERDSMESQDDPQQITPAQMTEWLSVITQGDLSMLIAAMKADRDIPEFLSFKTRMAALVAWASEPKERMQELYDTARQVIPNFKTKSNPH